MKLLIVTQAIDLNNPALGFFHRWIEEFSKQFEKITAICLEKGEYNLPANVKVLSLGKEKGESRPKYLFRFYKYIWQERKNYDAVFVHMNEEYVLLGALIWKILSKKIYLWRNHAKGSGLTNLAVFLSNKVFCTSPSSFTAQFKKTRLMPVGIDTDFFKPDPRVARESNSVLFLGRISPVKRVLEFIDWVKKAGYVATIAGPILPKDKAYGRIVKQRVFNDEKIRYVGSVNQEEARDLYQSHEIYANFTPVGSMDKTIFEAAACGCKLFIKNVDIRDIKVKEHNLNALMNKLCQEL